MGGRNDRLCVRLYMVTSRDRRKRSFVLELELQQAENFRVLNLLVLGRLHHAASEHCRGNYRLHKRRLVQILLLLAGQVLGRRPCKMVRILQRFPGLEDRLADESVGTLRPKEPRRIKQVLVPEANQLERTLRQMGNMGLTRRLWKQKRPHCKDETIERFIRRKTGQCRINGKLG